MSAPAEIPAGVQLSRGSVVGNKYRIDGCLGEGGMGVVLSATHLELDAPVAIKVVREEFADSDDIVARVLFEARAVARMRSNHVVRVLDVARLDSGCPYIVMEQLQGVDLGQALWDRGPFPVSQSIDYLLQACDGLAEAHGLGIVHRDLKPGNLFLATTPEGVVLKVLDFGISKEVNSPLCSISRIPRTSLTSAGDPVGSPYYMAPEQMRASPDVDARADIWSLGAILFELLTGRCPFEGETITEVCGKVLSNDPPSLTTFLNGAGGELEPVISRCLQKDPALRYQSVTEFAAALRAWRPTEPVRPSEPQPQPRPRRYASARLPLAMLASSAVLALAAVAFWETRGSAASLEANRVRPMLAAAAAPIWRALPEPPKVEPEPAVLSAKLQLTDTLKPSPFHNAVSVRNSAPVLASSIVSSEIEHDAAVLAAALDAADRRLALPTETQLEGPAERQLPDAADKTTDSPEAPQGDPPASTIDPVSGRYGL